MSAHSLATIGNIFDLLKFKLPSGAPINTVVNALAQRDDFSRFLPAFPANQGLTHHGLRTVSLPTGNLVDVGGSWKASKATHEPFVEALMTVRSAYKAPTDTFTTENEAVGRALLKANKVAHIMSINQAVTKLMMEGQTAGLTAQSGIVGLMKRDPYMTYDNKFTFNVGGTGSDLRSCWLMKPGVDTLHTLYNPNHPTLGIEQIEKGEQLEEGLGTEDDEHRWNIWIEFMIQKGIFVRDQRALKRICNVPCGISDLPGADLIHTIIEASIINAPTGGSMEQNANGVVTEMPSPWVLMCPERLYAKLVVEANNKLMVHTSNDNIYKTSLPMIGTGPNAIIIAYMDALNKDIGSGEDAVLAA